MADDQVQGDAQQPGQNDPSQGGNQATTVQQGQQEEPQPDGFRQQMTLPSERRRQQAAAQDATPADSSPPGERGGEDGETTSDDSNLLTQDQVDAIIEKRLRREREKYSDYDDLKAKVQEIEDADKSEREKLQERTETLEEENRRLQQEAQETRIRMAIFNASGKARIPSEAAYRLADLDKIETDDDGNVTNADALVQEVAQQYPSLVQDRMPSTEAANPSRDSEPTGKTDEDRAREYFGGGSGRFWQGGGVRLPEE